MEEQGEIILYQPDELVKLEVRLEDETVWLSQGQMAELFDVKENTITYHIKEIYNIGELEVNSTTRKIRVVRKEGNRNVNRNIDFYNLDMIISVGYRVSSKRGVRFRQWATGILKDYMLKGYSISQRIEHLENKMDSKFIAHDRELKELASKVDFFVRTSLPPVEGVFFNGQIFDAYVFANNLIRSANKSLLLIDNYIDESVLLMLAKRNSSASATIFTGRITSQLQLDLDKYNDQYPPINIRTYANAHDRFIIIDETEVYHIGASLKDLGKKLFAFTKMNMPASVIINSLEI
ncbi:virulence RhuM family protein [Bacteroides fragilis]|uniref:virulence RhuM family protein n=1 Tax=Bacteroides fragilis TaxID=817 RepID=UPI001C70A009|nr:RhuM family protein [Bacteroides fragilis]MBW9280209.1 DNA-binding protein [Bacteroides fragilis]